MTTTGDNTSVDADSLRSVLREHPVEFAVLFGSVARGEADAGSDIDIGVVFESFPTVRAYRVAREGLIADLMSATGRNEIDLVDLDDADPRVTRHGLADAILLYGDRAQLAELRERYQNDDEPRLAARLDRAGS